MSLILYETNFLPNAGKSITLPYMRTFISAARGIKELLFGNMEFTL